MVTNMNLLEVRRRILLNTPHIESASGNPAIFSTDMARDLKECKIRFSPVQAGECTPSPENVRAISGWDGVKVNANGTSISIPFPQTIYGGYVDLIKGEIVETHEHCYLTSVNSEALNANYNTETAVFFRCDVAHNFDVYGTYAVTDLLCDTLNPVSGAIHSRPSIHINDINRRLNYTNAVTMIMLKATFGITDEDTLAEMKTKISNYLTENPIGVSYKLATPNVYPLTPQTIKALRGLNNLYSDANGNVEAKFWKH